MRLEYRYGQIYYTDLHPGDMIPTAGGNYIVLTENDIDENGNLHSTQVSNSLEFSKDRSEYNENNK